MYGPFFSDRLMLALPYQRFWILDSRFWDLPRIKNQESRIYFRVLWNRPAFRIRMMNLFERFFDRRVLPPLASFVPFQFIGWRPPPDRPSPPPIGCETGFMAVPRTVGRTPIQRLRPALPRTMFCHSMLPTWPIVAR